MRHIYLWTACAIGAFCLGSSLFGQGFNAQLTGEVTDASGAVVPNVQLTLTNIATGATFTAATNATGVYRFPDLAPSQYKLTCLVPGFKRFEQSPITLQVNQALEVNVGLQTGEASDQGNGDGRASAPRNRIVYPWPGGHYAKH